MAEAATPFLPGQYSWLTTLPPTAWSLSRQTPVASNPFKQIAEKSPANCAVVGAVVRVGAVVWRMIFHSSPTKKNSLFFRMGPPRFQPKSLKRSFFFCFWPLRPVGAKKLVASNLSLRKNSNTPP